MDFFQILSLKPIATLSAVLFWLFVCLLLYPGFRRFFYSKIFLEKNPKSHIPWLDTFRGLAALYVFLSHAWYWTYPIFRNAQLSVSMLQYGSKGLGIFFMLSGYLISRQLSFNYTEPTVENMRAYILKRFFRIYPLYVFSVMLLAIFSNIYSLAPDGSAPFSFIISDLFMLRIYWANKFGNPVAWTLYTEVLLYIITPLMVWTIPKKGMLFVTTLCFLILMIGDQGTAAREFCSVKYFLLGVLTFELHKRFENLRLQLYGYLAVILGVILLLFDLQGPSGDIFAKLHLVSYAEGNPCTIGLGLAFALILIGLPHAPKIAFLFNFTPLRILGFISYSLYLLHPIYLILNFPELQSLKVGELYAQFSLQQCLPNWYFWGIFTVGFIPWAIISFILIEQPFLKINLGDRVKNQAIDKPILNW